MLGRILVLMVLLCASATFVGAAPTLDEIIDQCNFPSDPDIGIGACTALIQSGQLTKNNLAFAFYNRGNAYNAKGDYDSAIADYSEAIRLKPDYAQAFFNRGHAYYDEEDYDRAIADYTEAIHLDPDDADGFNNRGNAYSDKGDYDCAIADYTEAIRLEPDDALAFNNRGFAYNAKGDYDRAIADYNEAIRLDPDFENASFNRGVAYGAKGDYDRAIADYTEAIRIEPNDSEAFNNRGTAYNHKGDYDRAIADYNEAIRLKPDYALALKAMAWLLATCPDSKFRNGTEALQLALKAVKLADNWGNRDTLAAAYAEDGQFADAVREEETAIQMLPKDASNEDMADLQSRLALFKQNIAYHEKAKGVHGAAWINDKPDGRLAFRRELTRHAEPAFAPSTPKLSEPGQIVRLAPAEPARHASKQAAPVPHAQPKPGSFGAPSDTPVWPDPISAR